MLVELPLEVVKNDRVSLKTTGEFLMRVLKELQPRNTSSFRFTFYIRLGSQVAIGGKTIIIAIAAMSARMKGKVAL